MRYFTILGLVSLSFIACVNMAIANPVTIKHEGWSTMLDKARTAVVFIEFQAEWLAEDGLLYKGLVTDKAALHNAVEQAENVLAAARKHSWQIVHAGLDMRNDPTYKIFAGGKTVMGLRAAIPTVGTWTGKGAEFVAPFTPQQNEFVVSGRSGASIFTGSNLNSYLKNNKIDTLIMMGFATHVCVESSLREAHDAGYNVYIVTDASAGFIQEQDAYFAKHVLHHFGAGVSAIQLTELLAH